MMDAERFDQLTRGLSRGPSRRVLLRRLAGVVGGLVATTQANRAAEAAPHSVPLGGPCYRDRQCYNDYEAPRGAGLNPDLQIPYCADNGFFYDGEFNCCRYEGGACYADEHCCGYRSCVNGFCGFPEFVFLG
jgi:hypothetical protein